MSAAVNGLALSKLRAYGSGFLIFSDYGRAPIRLSALMEIPTIHIFTHDSIGVGEDGPTHQPIEQLASLRAMPALITIRPGDANEVAEAWRLTMELKHDPVVLVLSRQADADAGPLGVRAGLGSAAGRLRARRPCGRRPRGDHHGHRHRGAAGGRRVRAAVRGGRAGAGGLDALVEPVRAPGRGLPDVRAAAGRSPPGSASSRRPTSAGIATSARPARRSRCGRSACRRR